MIDLTILKTRNLARWNAARLTRGPEFAPVAKRLVAAKARYQAVEAKTGVPWFFIAVTHQRESSQRWDRSLAQGDPWDRVSTHVPKGRGPFSSWEAAAIDALVNCSPYAARNKDWSVGGLLTMLERYNGLGYASRGIPSPYVWSGTNQYQRGKYVSDGVFAADVVDVQLGCAGLLLAMQTLDHSINLEGKKVTLPPPPKVNAETGTAGGVVVAGGAAAQQAHASGIRPLMVAAIVVAVLVVAIVAYVMVKRRPGPLYEQEPEHEPEGEML